MIAGILARNRAGQGGGLPSWCTAHPQTLAAILRCYRHDTAPILIEATCNQVNQFGGYTGMTPADFVRFVHGIARAEGVDPARLILGGDHLGPNPWRAEPAPQAMAKARDMVAAYAATGFTKIHLDASMPCGGETLTETGMAARAAELCAVAESVAPGRPAYVIGTEVPVPGARLTRKQRSPSPRPKPQGRPWRCTARPLRPGGSKAAFGRVIGVVVQPGVDFGNERIMAYDSTAAARLAALAPCLEGPLYEAHSTDYQSTAALAALVQDHFAILKVGPELTFAFRQAVMALERLEERMGLPPSGVTAALLAAMRAARRIGGPMCHRGRKKSG
ncbi:MAG: class II D-tagatose-bisphosphate aldolase, non-catalytic subunit [Tabrizicola sp.]|nr:class II D-tagatose-bisphosphate aldolase, non-catalytic subunit [Tabrizicola sp.]